MNIKIGTSVFPYPTKVDTCKYEIGTFVQCFVYKIVLTFKCLNVSLFTEILDLKNKCTFFEVIFNDKKGVYYIGDIDYKCNFEKQLYEGVIVTLIER